MKPEGHLHSQEISLGETHNNPHQTDSRGFPSSRSPRPFPTFPKSLRTMATNSREHGDQGRDATLPRSYLRSPRHPRRAGELTSSIDGSFDIQRAFGSGPSSSSVPRREATGALRCEQKEHSGSVTWAGLYLWGGRADLCAGEREEALGGHAVPASERTSQASATGSGGGRLTGVSIHPAFSSAVEKTPAEPGCSQPMRIDRRSGRLTCLRACRSLSLA